jgi:hypothetical protein
MLYSSVQIALRAYRHRATRLPNSHRPELLASLAGFATAAVFLSHAYAFYVFGLLTIVMNQDRAWRIEGYERHRRLNG